jgi:hypothetical protein
MYPWGVMNDWLWLEVEERVQRYGGIRRPRRTKTRRNPEPTTVTRPVPAPRPSTRLSQPDVTTCA